jgi:hypothetical protein|uniref:Uncharacterized protein n=1 Tax=Phaeodactylum tricornutum TaxID=2850 RepID=A0A8J9T7G9_PHATR
MWKNRVNLVLMTLAALSASPQAKAQLMLRALQEDAPQGNIESDFPSDAPSDHPSDQPSDMPSETPSLPVGFPPSPSPTITLASPTVVPTIQLSLLPTIMATNAPSESSVSDDYVMPPDQFSMSMQTSKSFQIDAMEDSMIPTEVVSMALDNKTRNIHKSNGKRKLIRIKPL